MITGVDDRLLAFKPDQHRGIAIDRRMQRELGLSLDHIAEATAQAAPKIAADLRGPRDLISAGGAIGPLAFGLYYELGEALLSEDVARAEAAARGLSGTVPRAPGLAIDRVGGDLPELDRVIGLRMGPEARMFAPIPPDVHREFAALLTEGLALLDAGLPALAGEIRAILSQILLAQAPEGARIEFDGASHFQFWGLLFLNPRHHRTPLAVAEVLAHEAGHSLLFGLTVDETMVRNPDEDLFESPLRRDPRPMDGIYHATFVSARMAWAMEGLAASGLLSPVEREAALAAAATDRVNFAKGIAVIDTHGDLTPTGQEIIDNARDWVMAG